MQREKYRPAAKFASFFYGQKFTAKCLLALSLFVSAPLFANEMCTQLCVPCKENPADSTCARIDTLCSCQALIDSIQAAETARTEKVKALKETLKTNLSENCQKEFCAFKVHIENEELQYFHKAKLPTSIKETISNLQTTNAATDTASTSEALITLSSECQNFCGFCPAEKPQDSSCARIESICKCKAFADQEARLVEKAKADSIQKFQELFKKTENLSLAADSICAFQKTVPDSMLHVTLQKSDMTILDIQTFKEPSTDTVPAAPLAPPADTTKSSKDSVQPPRSHAHNHVHVISTGSSDYRHFYLGLSFHGGQVYDRSLLDRETSRETSITIGADVFMRSYIYKWGSFQWGLGAVYQYGEYDLLDYRSSRAGIAYHNIIAELPLEFRFGFPIGQAFSPFFSLNWNIRKPIYQWYNWYFESNGDYYRSDSYGDEWNSSSYASSDFEFLGFFGLGVEIYRHFSLEWQWLVDAKSTYADNKGKPFEDGTETWRIKLDIVF